MAYLFSFWAKTPASGFSVMTILGIVSGKKIKGFKVTFAYLKVLESKDMVKSLAIKFHIFYDRFDSNDGCLDMPWFQKLLRSRCGFHWLHRQIPIHVHSHFQLWKGHNGHCPGNYHCI